MAADPIPDPAPLLEHVPWVRALARSLVADPHQADDLAQETWVRALRKPPADRRNLRGWLASILRNLWRQEHRGNQRRRRREAEVAGSAAAPREAWTQPSQVLERVATHRMLVERVTELDEPFRTTLLLHYFDGLTAGAIGTQLGIPEATVRSRLRRGLARLRERLDRSTDGGRETWVSALAPFVAPFGAPPPAPVGTAAVGIETSAGATALAGPTLGALIMNAKWKLVVVSLVAVGGVTLLPGLFEDAARPETSSASTRAAPILSAPPVDEVAPQPAVTSAAPRERSAVAAEVDAPLAIPSAAPTPVVRGRVLDAHARPVGDLRLLFDETHGSPVPIRSAADGSFEIATEHGGFVRSADRRWATLLGARVDPGSTADSAQREPVVVVAPGVAIAGVVRDAAERPIAGARVVAEPSSGYLLDFNIVLDESEEREFATRTDAEGRFAFGCVPALPGSMLATRQDGYDDDLRPVPSVDDAALRITLLRVSLEERLLRGQVLDPDGRPLPGAHVSTGAGIVRADEDGKFVFDAETSRDAEEVVALVPGYLPARARAESSPDGPLWPLFLALRVGGDPKTIDGRVVDEAGEPLAGVRVWLVDPTWFGNFESAGVRHRSPVQLESVLADPAARGEAGDAETYRVWHWVETDEDGEFRLRGLLDRTYVVRAMDHSTLLTVDSEPVLPGSHRMTVVLPVRDGVRRVEGRVVSRADGRPVSGADVVVMNRSFQSTSPTGTSVSWDSSTEAVRTDEDGRFVLEQLPLQRAFVHVSCDGIKSARLAVEQLDLEDLEIRVEGDRRRCHVQLELKGDRERANSFALLDADGVAAHLSLRRAGQQVSTPQMPVTGGRSVVLAVLEGAYDLVLYKDDVEVERKWVQVVPGEVVTLSL